MSLKYDGIRKDTTEDNESYLIDDQENNPYEERESSNTALSNSMVDRQQRKRLLDKLKGDMKSKYMKSPYLTKL